MEMVEEGRREELEMRTIELVVHAAECQRCTGLSAYGSSPDHAALVARNSGWLEIDGRTLCWQCKEQVQEEKRRRQGTVKPIQETENAN